VLVGLLATVFVMFLVCTTNIVLRWGSDRMATANPPSEVPLHPISLPKGWREWAVPLVGLLIWVLFMRSIITDWTAYSCA
jgi:hypothetical protein